MSPIQRVLRQATWRLLVNDLTRRLVVCATAAIAGLGLTLIVKRVFGLALPWPTIVPAVGGGVVVAALAWTVAARRSRLAVARVVDERADLRESISTTLTLGDRDDPWSSAVRQTAIERAGSVRVRESIPIETPRLWPVPIAGVLALAILWWAVPELDIFGRGAQRAQDQAQRVEARQVRQEIEANQRSLDDLMRQAGLEAGDAADPLDALVPTERAKAQELRRAAVRRLTNLADRLEAERSGAKARRMEALKNQLRQLRQPGRGPMDAMAQDLARGSMAKARRELDSLARQLANGELSQEQRDRLEDQLESMSRQMDAIAQQQRDNAQQQMREMGLSQEQIGQMMGDPQRMQEMLDQMDQLSPEQRERLMELASKMAASGDMGQMSETMRQMAQQLKPGELGEAMGEMGEMLGAMEMTQSELEAMDAAMAEAMDQLGEMSDQMSGGDELAGMMGGKPDIGQWREGASDQPGLGSGGPGKGSGASVGDTASEFTLRKERAKSQNQAGPIIARSLVDGPQLIGASHAQLAEAVGNAQQRASEAIDTMVIARELQGAVKDYFRALEQQSDPGASDAPEAPKTDEPE